MTNQLSVVVGVVAGVVARVITRVGVELRLRLWKLDAVDDARVQQYLTGGDGNLCLHLHAVLRCFSSPGVTTPSDGALQRHPHTLTALRIESGVEDASGERRLCVRSEDGGCGRSGAPLIWSSGSCGRERWAVVKPMACLPVSLCTGLLACLPKFHTATRTPPDDTVQRARLPQFTHMHARLPVYLHGGLLACVPSTHACSHGTRGARRHVYCFSIRMINGADLLLNRSMARIHCWSNAHGSNK